MEDISPKVGFLS